MASAQAQSLVFSGLRGRDGSTASVGATNGIPPNKAAEIENVFLDGISFGEKRPGTSALGVSFSSGGPFDLSGGYFTALHEGSDGTMYAMDETGTLGYLSVGATQWIEIPLSDAQSGTSPFPTFTQMRNGAIAFAYANSASRMHVIENNAVRRMGLGVPAAPVVTDRGSGSYAATLRYYRLRLLYQSGGVTLRMGEAGPSTAFTPSGTGLEAEINKPAAVEDETHWQVEVSLDDSVWYVLSSPLSMVPTVILVYDDSADTTSYSTNDAAPLAGRYSNWIDVDFLTTDENRLIGAKQSTGRVYYSPVRGTTDDNFHDEEFVPNTVIQKNWIDMTDDGTNLTGISKPTNGQIYVFRQDAMAQLVQTHVDTAPYRVNWIFRDMAIGATTHQSIVTARDEAGRPAVYWWSPIGPYRYGVSGMQYLGDDLRDLLNAGDESIFPTAIYECGVYWELRDQVWFWVATTGALPEARVALVFHTKLGRVEREGYVRDGWIRITGDMRQASSATVASRSAGTPVGTPYIGFQATAAGAPKILYFSPTYTATASVPTTDDSTAFQGLVTLPDRHYAGMDFACRVTGASVIGSTGSQVLRLTLTSDYGAQTARTSDVSMVAVGSETRTRKVFEDAAIDDQGGALKIQLGDSAASGQTWVIDELHLRTERGPELQP